MRVDIFRKGIEETIGRPLRTATVINVHGDRIDVQVGGSPKLLRGIKVIGGVDDIVAGDTVTLTDSDGYVYAQSCKARSGIRTVAVGIASEAVGLSPHSMSYHTDDTTWHAGLSGADLHDPKAHDLSDAAIHTASGLTTGYVIRATGATTFAWAQLQHSDLGTIAEDDHHDPVTSGDGIALTGQQVAVDLASPSGLEFSGGDLQINDSVAGSGLTISGKVLAVGVGNGIEVSADAVAVNLAETSGLSFSGSDLQVDDSVAGDGISISSKVLSVDLHSVWSGLEIDGAELRVDLDATFTWSGAHYFQSNLYAHHVIPEKTDTYDLGTVLKLWRKAFISELDAVIFAESTASLVGGRLIVPHGYGTLSLSVASTDTDVDFGQAMTEDDFIELRSLGQVEYMQIDSLDAGTRYNVTRDLDGSGPNNWPAGTVYMIAGYDGDGRIELDAQSGGPRISILEQGTSYNETTERVRIGDLNGWGPFSSESYGWAVGDYSGDKYAYYEESEGLKIRGHAVLDTGELVTLSVTGTLTLSGSGMMITAASPNPRIEITTSEIAGYSDETTKEFWLDATDGIAYAGEGVVELSSTGIKIEVSDAYADLRSYRFEYDGSVIASIASKKDDLGDWMRIKVFNDVYYNSNLQLEAQGATGMYGMITQYTHVTGSSHYTYSLAAAGSSNAYFWFTGNPGTVYIGGDVSGYDGSDGDLRIVSDNGTVVGQLTCEDTTWFRINQDVAKNIYTPRMLRVDGGLVSGNTSAGAGEIYATSDIRVGGGIALGATDTNPASGELMLQDGGGHWHYLEPFDGGDGVAIRVGTSGDEIFSVVSSGGTARLCVGHATWGVRIQNGLWIGGLDTAPDDNDLHIAGSINKSTALGCRVRRDANQTIGNSSWTSISFAQEDHDTDTCWSIGTPTKLYAKHAGYYMAGGQCVWTNNTTGSYRLIRVYYNNTTELVGSQAWPSVDAYLRLSCATGMFYMAVNDYVEIQVYQDSGGNLDIVGGAGATAPYSNGWLARIA